MIKINSKNFIKLSDEYVKKMLPKFRKKYRVLKYGKDINPFTGTPVSELFEDINGDFDEELATVILTDPFSLNAQNKYLQLNCYYKTASLVFYDREYLSWKIDKMTIGKYHISQVLEDYVQSLNNLWIESDIKRKSDYKITLEKFDFLIKDIRDKMNQLNRSIQKVVDYKHMGEGFRHKILSSIDVKVCPYCNRQYITTYSVRKDIRSTSDLDHFYPKSAFQLYSLAILNCIPACTICNSRFKKARKLRIQYPFEEGFEKNAIFKIKPKRKADLNSLIGNNVDFDLILEVDNSYVNNMKIKGNIEMFRLEEVYQSHKGFVQELLLKNKAHPKAYKKMIEELLKIDLTDEELNLFLYGFSGNEKELLNKPLSKLTFDILDVFK